MKSHDEIWSEWQELVNMTPAELRKWLNSENSKSVGDTGGQGESTGHKSGKRILQIKDRKKADLDDDDWAHMAKIVGTSSAIRPRAGRRTTRRTATGAFR